MKSINIHKFEKEQEALKAIDVINKGQGIPKKPTSITQTYAQPQQYDDIWYIQADKITEKYLGQSEILTIEENDN